MLENKLACIYGQYNSKSETKTIFSLSLFYIHTVHKNSNNNNKGSDSSSSNKNKSNKRKTESFVSDNIKNRLMNERKRKRRFLYYDRSIKLIFSYVHITCHKTSKDC